MQKLTSEGQLFKKILGSEWLKLHSVSETVLKKNLCRARIGIDHKLFSKMFIQAGIFKELS